MAFLQDRRGEELRWGTAVKRVASFPSSAWERISAKLRIGRVPEGEAQLLWLSVPKQELRNEWNRESAAKRRQTIARGVSPWLFIHQWPRTVASLPQYGHLRVAQRFIARSRYQK